MSTAIGHTRYKSSNSCQKPTVAAPVGLLVIKYAVLNDNFGNYTSTWTVRVADLHIFSNDFARSW